MTKKSVAEALPVDHLPVWQLRQHLIDVTVALADELVDEGDDHRLAALTELYQATLDALQARTTDGRVCR
jgi:hypothetical protein